MPRRTICASAGGIGRPQLNALAVMSSEACWGGSCEGWETSIGWSTRDLFPRSPLKMDTPSGALPVMAAGTRK